MTLDAATSLGVFLVLSVATASSGAIFRPGEWYRGLDKPAWTPPNLAFPIVWSVLFLMIAVSGWLAWEASGQGAGAEPATRAALFAPFALQMVLNAMWSFLFFGRRRPDLAFADLIALWLAISANIAAFAAVSTVAAWLLVPYLAWVTLAGCLNLSVWRRNPGILGRG